MDLAFEIVKEFHDAFAAEAAKAEFLRFSEREIHFRRRSVGRGGRRGQRDRACPAHLPDRLAVSSQEARRLLKSGAVRVDGIKQAAETSAVTLKDGMLLQVGKRRFCRVRVAR